VIRLLLLLFCFSSYAKVTTADKKALADFEKLTKKRESIEQTAYGSMKSYLKENPEMKKTFLKDFHVAKDSTLVQDSKDKDIYILYSKDKKGEKTEYMFKKIKGKFKIIHMNVDTHQH
jgi:hypothetical protein